MLGRLSSLIKLLLLLFLLKIPSQNALFTTIGQNGRPPATSEFKPFHPPIVDNGDLAIHSNRLAKMCRNYCSITESDAAQCWNDTLTFYEQMLVGMLRRTIVAESNRILWVIYHNEHPNKLDYGGLVNESYGRFMQLPRGQIVRDKNNWEKAPLVFEHISPAIMESVRPLVDKMLHYYGGEHNEVAPSLWADCPRGCERSWALWKWLFMCSLLLSLLLLGLLSFLVFLLDRREQRAWRLESTEFGENATVVVALENDQKSSQQDDNHQQQIAMKVI